MKYKVTIMAKDCDEDFTPTTRYYFDTYQQVVEFIQIAISASNDSIFKIEKSNGDDNGN